MQPSYQVNTAKIISHIFFFLQNAEQQAVGAVREWQGGQVRVRRANAQRQIHHYCAQTGLFIKLRGLFCMI